MNLTGRPVYLKGMKPKRRASMRYRGDDELLARAYAKGTDREFRNWVSRQPSCVSGKFSEVHDGEGRNIACHVRRANEAGTAYKPPYSCVPLTFDEHAIQHGKLGEEAFGGKGWFDEQRVRYLRAWLES